MKLMSLADTFSQVLRYLTFLDDVKILLDLVHSCHQCCGNGNERFMGYSFSKDGRITNPRGTVEFCYG